MNTTQTAVTTVKVLGTMVMRREASITRFLEDMVEELRSFGFDILRYSLAAVLFLVEAEWYQYKTEFQTIEQPDEVVEEVYQVDTTRYLARCLRYNMQPVSLTPQQQVQWTALTTPAVNAINKRGRTYSMTTIAGCKAALDSLLD